MNTVLAFPAPDPVVSEPDWTRLFSEPADLARASEVWRGVVAEMTLAGTLSVANGPAIMRYVLAVATFDRAAAEVGKNGPVLRAKRTGTPAHNAWWTVLRDADVTASQAEDRLGLSPRTRDRVAAAKRKHLRAPVAADAYLLRE